MSGLSRLERIHLAHSRQIERSLAVLGDHQGITQATLLRWMANFADCDLDLAAKILHHVKYYSSANIWSMARNLADIVRMEFDSLSIEWNKVIFVPIGGPYSGSATIARVLRETGRVAQTNIKYMIEVDRIPAAHIGGLVLLDDFSGTGSTLDGWWRNVAEPIVLPKEAPYAVGLLIVNSRARQVIQSFVDRVYCVEELDEVENVLSQNSSRFTAEEKTSIRQYCRKTGCPPEYLTGWRDCGLLLAFKHGCPDNSLPILWGDWDDWEPLFKRRAV